MNTSLRTSAVIGALEVKLEIMTERSTDRPTPTERPTNQATEGHEGSCGVSLPIIKKQKQNGIQGNAFPPPLPWLLLYDDFRKAYL